MPRTKLEARVRQMKAPARDPIKALFLERMFAEDISQTAFAVSLGIHPNTFYRMMREHTNEWRWKHIMSACVLLGISKEELAEAIRL